MLRLQFPFNPAAHVVFFRAAAFSYSSHIAWDIVRTVDELPEIVPFLYFEQYNRNRNDFCFRCGGRFFFWYLRNETKNRSIVSTREKHSKFRVRATSSTNDEIPSCSVHDIVVFFIIIIKNRRW